MDILTNEIVKQLNDLPIIKKKAILELIKKDSNIQIKDENASFGEWREALLNTTVWTDSEIDEIIQAREFINKWKPKQLS